jgi:hypothetical protein
MRNDKSKNSEKEHSISSINSSQNYSIKKDKSGINFQNSLSEIGVDDLNCSINPNNVTEMSIIKENSEKGIIKIDNRINTYYSTTDNPSPSSNQKRRKLVKRFSQSSQFNNSKLGKNKINETNSFCDEINESSITVEGKDNIITTNDNSCLNLNFGYLATEEKLRNLVKKSKRSNERNRGRMRTDISKAIDEIDFLQTNQGDISNNNNIIEVKNFANFSNFELSKMLFDVF